MAVQNMFSCGNEYNTPNIALYWAATTGTLSVVNGGQLTSTSGGASWSVTAPGINITNGNTSYVGAACYFNTAPASTGDIIAYGEYFMNIQVSPSGQLICNPHNDGPIATSASGAVRFGPGQRNYIEVIYFCANGANVTAHLYNNGVLVASGTGSPNGGAPLNTVNFGDLSAVCNGGLIMDDIYIADNTFPTPPTPIGNFVVNALLPNQDASVQWTPVGASPNFACVDNVPPNPSEYVQGGSVGLIDSYVVNTFSAGVSAIIAVVAQVVAEQDAAGNRAVEVGVGNGVSTTFGSPFGLGTVYAAFQSPFSLNPNNGDQAWTFGDLFGIEAAITVST